MVYTCAQSVPSSKSLFPSHTFRLVKLSSPYLNVIIIVGAIFFYVDVIISGVDSNTASRLIEDILCQVYTDTIFFCLAAMEQNWEWPGNKANTLAVTQTLDIGCVPFKFS